MTRWVNGRRVRGSFFGRALSLGLLLAAIAFVIFAACGGLHP